MRVIGARVEIIKCDPYEELIRHIELCGRTAYKSEERITETSAPAFVKMLLAKQPRPHLSVLEHAGATVRFIVDRGVSHELVRHRIASYTMESTRYCNYAKRRFGRELTFIKPCYWELGTQDYLEWVDSMRNAEISYLRCIDRGNSPDRARCLLPHSIKTEVVATLNLSMWRHVLEVRTWEEIIHPQMLEVMNPLLGAFQARLPGIFDDIKAGI